LNASALIERLALQTPVLAGLADGVAGGQACWRPAPGRWSIVEVYGHLLDEEREDFRARLDLTLHRPEADWPPIDPQGWVEARAYAARDLAGTVAEWRAERERSLAWLRALTAPDWSRAHSHPKFGSLAAGELLAAWVAHDLLHLRQLAKLHYDHAAALAAPQGVGYAGDW